MFPKSTILDIVRKPEKTDSLTNCTKCSRDIQEPVSRMTQDEEDRQYAVYRKLMLIAMVTKFLNKLGSVLEQFEICYDAPNIFLTSYVPLKKYSQQIKTDVCCFVKK